MDTTGEIRRKEAEEFARQQREERERLVEAEREKEGLLLFPWVGERVFEGWDGGGAAEKLLDLAVVREAPRREPRPRGSACYQAGCASAQP